MARKEFSKHTKRSRDVICAHCSMPFDRGYAISSKRAQQPQLCSRECHSGWSKQNAENNLYTRFWANVETGENDACWEWKGRRNSSGYGIFDHNNRPNIASRFCFEMQNGPLPSDIFVCHRCDNPACVNPRHLWPGTHRENMKDAVSKGRTRNAPRYGSASNKAKLSEDAVHHIRASMDPVKELASAYHVSTTAIRKVLNRENWGWLK